MTGELLSLGLDLGTSTTQLVLSRLRLENQANAFSVPRVSITDKEVVYRSQVHFTPLVSDTRIDAAAIRAIVEEEYRRAGVRREDLQTGAVIITGETARKENAREVLEALTGLAGDFVVATAGPDLESVLAARGAGVDRISREKHTSILHFDIGGGTSNLALYDRGELVDTGCLDVGGRLVKVDRDTGRITYVTKKLQGLFPGLEVGAEATRALLTPAAEAMTDALLEAAGLREPGRWLAHFVTHKTVRLEPKPQFITFSGGVADCVWTPTEDDFSYGDMGPLLGRMIRKRFEEAGARLLPTAETIRATVVGAGSHATELSGSTIFYRDVNFPIKNLPVLRLEEGLENVAEEIGRKLPLFADEGGQGPVCLSLQGPEDPGYDQVQGLARAIRKGLEPLIEGGETTVVALERDLAKALGQCLYPLLPRGRLLCIDSVYAPPGSYIDLLAPACAGTVLPVVVKTLAFETKTGGTVA